MTVATPDIRSARKTLTVCGGAHALHDGFTDLLNVLYPLLQAQFGLSYAAIGALKAVYSGAMASGQIPSGKLAVRFGGVRVLAIGTALVAVGYGLAGLSGSLYGVIAGLFLAGLGGSTQHPIGSSFVAAAYPGSSSRTALGTYNFTGDVGKVALPAAFAVVSAALGWQQALVVTAALAILGAGLIVGSLKPVALHDKAADDKAMAGQDRPWAYWLLFSIHIADNLVRTGFMIFLPFLLRDKGADLPTIGLGLSLLFAGGVGRAHRSGDDPADPAPAAALVAGRACPVADRGPDAERHLIGAVRHRSGVREPAAAHPRLRDLLYRRFDRGSRGTVLVRTAGRCRGPRDRAGRRLLHCPHHGADGVGASPGLSLELAAHRGSHSITSSARCRIRGGIASPRLLDVLALMVISNRVGCSTGRSAGLAPLRIRST